MIADGAVKGIGPAIETISFNAGIIGDASVQLCLVSDSISCSFEC